MCTRVLPVLESRPCEATTVNDSRTSWDCAIVDTDDLVFDIGSFLGQEPIITSLYLSATNTYT